MFMKIGNDKPVCVKETEIIDINCGLNVVEFKVDSPRQRVLLITETGLIITCKSQDYKEFLNMIKLSRQVCLN